MIENAANGPIVMLNHADVLELQLARGDHANALVPSMVRTLADAVENPPARVVLLTGQGPHFCAGGDHAALQSLDEAEMRSFRDDITRLFKNLETCPVPIVAGAHGASVGGGVEMLLRCDFVVAADTSRFRLPQVKLAIGINRRSLRLLLSKVGAGQARTMVLLGEELTATNSALPDFVVPENALLKRAHEIAASLAALPPSSLGRLRKELNHLIDDQSAGVEARRG